MADHSFSTSQFKPLTSSPWLELSQLESFHSFSALLCALTLLEVFSSPCLTPTLEVSPSSSPSYLLKDHKLLVQSSSCLLF